MALHLLGENEAAAIQFDLALALEPNNPYRYSSRAYFKDRMGDTEGALHDYEKAVELDPEDAIAYNNKGLIEEKLGYQARSKKSFDKSNALVDYEPIKTQSKQHSPSMGSEFTPPSKSRMSIVKSLTTKEGLKDFLRFCRGLMADKGSILKK